MVPHLVGIGLKASPQLFEGVFQSEIPRVGGRGGEGEKESADGPENDISTATATTRSVTGLSKRTVLFLSPGQRKNIRIFFKNM